MSGLSAASKLSAAMQSVRPSSQLTSGPQSQHHVEQHQQQYQSADGSSSAVAAARRELHFSVEQGAENVERKTYTKTWQVDGGQLFSSDGGDVHQLSPLVRGTTAEIEARHAQLDDILVGLLNEASANKGQAPTSGSVTLTSQRVSKSQPKVKQYTETSTLLKTEQTQRDETPSITDTQASPTRQRPDTDERHEPRRRPYASDSEEPMTWLDDQRAKLKAGRRSGWRERSTYDKQFVSELRSAQSALSSLRGTRPRTHSESEMLDTAGLPRRGRRSEPPSYQSDRSELKPTRFVSGVERRPFTTQQTLYTFGVSPQRTTSLDQGLYDSPAVPDRTDSSREAMARQRRSQDEEYRRYYTYSSTTRNQSSVNELDDTLNSLQLQSVPERPAVEQEEEVISLQPIGRGVQDLEPSSTQLSRIETSLEPIGRGIHNLEPSAQSPGIKTSPVTSSFPTEDVVMSTFPLTPVSPYDNAGRRLVASQSVPSSLSRVDQVVESQSVHYQQPVPHVSRTVNYGTYSTNTLVNGGYRDSMPVLSRNTLPPPSQPHVTQSPGMSYTLPSEQSTVTSVTRRQYVTESHDQQRREHHVKQQELHRQQQQLQQQQRDLQQRQQDTQRQQQLFEQQEQQRQLEIQRQQEQQRQQEIQRQVELERQQEIQRQKEAELLRQQELKRQQELQRQQEMIRQQELQRQQEIIRQQEYERQQQQLRRRQEEELERQRQEILRQQELKRQQELQQQELQRQQEMIRQQEYERQQQIIEQQQVRRQEEEIERQRQELQRQQKLLEQQELQYKEQQQQQQQQMVQRQYVMREERSGQPVMNDIQVERVVTVPRTGRDYTGSHGYVSTGDSTMQNGFVSQRIYQTQQRTWTGHGVGRSLSVDTSSQAADHVSGLDSGRFNTTHQLAVSPGAYMGYSRTQSFSSIGDNVELSLQTPRFVRDTSQLWHRPNISRDEAIQLLKDKPAGSFVVRNSSSFQGSFGLAVKVAHLPPNVLVKGGGDPDAELVRHFLIETTSKGVRLKGCNNEPTFGSLAALVYQHSITPLALPCKLLLPSAAEMNDVDWVDGSTMPQLMTHGAACNVIYINSVDVESLTGAVAVTKAIERTFTNNRSLPKTTVVHFKVTSQGITLTDNKRSVFFRRYYPLESVTYCGLDSQDCRWTFTVADSETVTGRLFGFVARKTATATDNACHLFAELDPSQPATAIVSFIEKLLIKHGHCLK